MARSRCISGDASATKGSLVRTTLSIHALPNSNCRYLTTYGLNFAPFCNDSDQFAHSFTQSFLEHSKGLPRIHAPTSLWYVANNLKSYFEIRSLSRNQRNENSHAFILKGQFSFFNMRKLLFLPCYERDQGVNSFCVKVLLNKDWHQRKIIFLLPSIVNASERLGVMT